MDHRISRTIQFIEANYSRAISIEDLAQLAKLSSSRLRYLFKTEIGVSPMRYLKQTRILKAEQLLAHDISLGNKEVMAKVGLNDRSHFARDFKRAFGVAPGEYKQTRGSP